MLFPYTKNVFYLGMSLGVPVDVCCCNRGPGRVLRILHVSRCKLEYHNYSSDPEYTEEGETNKYIKNFSVPELPSPFSNTVP